MTLRFDQDVSKILKEESVADNVSWQANVEMRNSTVRRNRARSILISTQGDVLIENNNFSTCTGVSLLFEGDATFWYESGPVRNVIIRNNRFSDFGLGGTGSPVLQFTPRVKHKARPTSYYHKNIVFENNECVLFGRAVVYANSVENLIFRGNTITTSRNYPISGSEASMFRINISKDVLIKDNVSYMDISESILKDEYSNVKLNGNRRME